MDTWSEADSYELYMGRWSAPIGRSFLAWVGVSDGARWLDVGCGTGALSTAIAETCAPRGLSGVDASPGFVETARGGVEAGFGGIEIHGAHGYLICNFLSSYSNRRQDDFGGSVENRFRFAHAVIQAVRGVVPTEQPIDAISVSAYGYSDKAFGTGQNMAQITREATHLPIMICGKIYNRATAEDALKNADIVLSAKSMLLNPNWVDDLRNNVELPLHRSEDANVAYTREPLR